MKIFYTLSSPYARCVQATAAEIGITGQIDWIIAHPFDNSPELVAANPLGKVPCLVDDGEMIVDSEVICDYLDGNFTGGVLFNPIYADWRLKSLYAMVNGLIDSLVARRMEELRKKDDCFSSFWWDRHTQAILRSLDYLQSKLGLVPSEFSVLHIAITCALAYLDFRHDDIEWHEGFEPLHQFYQQQLTRDCFQDNAFQG